MSVDFPDIYRMKDAKVRWNFTLTNVFMIIVDGFVAEKLHEHEFNWGIKRVVRRTDSDADTLWVIEGAASYGVILAGTVAAHGIVITEAPRMDTKKNRCAGKSDVLTELPKPVQSNHGRAAAVAGGETVSSPPE